MFVSPGFRRFVLVTLALSVATEFTVAAADEPEWIWSNRESAAGEATLQSTFKLGSATHIIRLKCIADYCAVDVLIDGNHHLTLDPYAPVTSRTLNLRLAAGQHTVTLRCRGVEGPSAVALTLKFIGENGFTELETSETWQNAKSSGPVSREFWGTETRAVSVSAFDDYEQWRDAPARADADDLPKFVLPTGFRIDRIRRATPDEGSWVSLVFDPQGRVIVAREDTGLLRMTLAADGQRVTKVETIDDSLKECRGLEFFGGNLFVNANNSKAMFRLRDTNGDDQFDERTKVREFPGNVGHGRNDLAVRGNRLFSIHGDAVRLPMTDITRRTSPFRAARQGKDSNEGALLAYAPDTGSWELLCAGLRNPFGVAIHPEHGEPFTYDADAEFDMGAPWYRPTRLLHLVSGADYGWRGVTGQWPPYFPDRADNAAAVCDIGKGSPTAVKFGTDSNFPPPYQRALYILDWAYGRIIAVHLMPNGASYRAESELFARGTPLNVTDLDFGPDGAMYVVTGGRKTQSALYRIRYTGPKIEPAPATAQQTARRTAARAARAIRRTLETFHEPNNAAIASVWPYLKHADPAIRYAARVALEHQPTSQWDEKACLEPDPAIRATALMALARSGNERVYRAIIAQLNSIDMRDCDETQLMTNLRTYSLVLNGSDEWERPIRVQSAQRLAELFPRSTVESVTPIGLGSSANHELAQLLIQLGHLPATGEAMKLLRHSTSQNEKLRYLYVLRTALGLCTLDQSQEWFTALNDAMMYPGGRGFAGFLESMRTDALGTLTTDEKKSLASVIKPPEPVAAEPLPKRSFVREWKLEDFEVGESGARDRDLANGRKMFGAALCNRCHRVGLDGTAFGPDLTSIGSRFSPRDILQSIIHPSAVIADPYRAVNIVTASGKSFSGQVLTSGDYRARTVRLVPDPLKPSVVVEIAKAEIEERRVSLTSPMPTGLLNTLTRDDILDLLAYLIAGGR